MSIWGWIIAIIGSLFIGTIKKLPVLIRMAAGGVFAIICFFIFPSNPFTGDIQEDAEIVYERIYEDRENPDAVMDELAEFYVEEGYGMNRAKQVLKKSAELYYNRDK